MGADSNATFTDEERSQVTFVGNQLYRHKVLRVNYTTYDVRRNQDSLNPRNHADIMLLADDSDIDEDTFHPYLYARILGIFHARVRHVGKLSKSADEQHINFLWVRWFDRDLTYKAGFAAKRLHRLEFQADGDGDEAFGFLDPDWVVRGSHLIPAFAHGRSSDPSPFESISIRSQDTGSESDEEKDWRYHYVGM